MPVRERSDWSETGDGRCASPPCFSGNVEAPPVAAGRPPDVAAWRKAERTRLLAARAALPLHRRVQAAAAIAANLDALLGERCPVLEGRVISGWWPIKAELDLRGWLSGLAARGARAALPVVTTRQAPLAFRPWACGTQMVRGIWNIPVPAPAETVRPDIVLAPVVGWDGMGFRLGYGGGYFDRTLAALWPRPLAIGIGLASAALPSIHPLPHDIPMAAVVTEEGIRIPPGFGAARAARA